jgi:EAL domain-containing protein (putative c-di-GMP-specific phosphodiesterase class I)
MTRINARHLATHHDATRSHRAVAVTPPRKISMNLDLPPARAIYPLADDTVLEALESRRFGVQYEPIVELSSGNTVAYEALARFARADGEQIPAAWMFGWLHGAPSLLVETELALKSLQLAHAPGHTLFVNLDPDSFTHAEDGGAAFLSVLGSASCDVVVEAIENLDAIDVDRARAMVAALRRAGLPFALDDVGATHSLVSFEMLAFADYLKFDRSLVRAPRDGRQLALVHALVTMTTRTGARTVVEGIEAADDLALARELGVGYVQGRIFSDRYVVVPPEPR